VLHLHSIAPVPDLAVLLFATDLEHTSLPAAAAAAAEHAGGAVSAQEADSSSSLPAAAGASSSGSAGEAAAEHAGSAGSAQEAGSSSDPADKHEQQQQQLRLQTAYAADQAQLDSSKKPVHAVLLGGYARYVLEHPSDLAALLQLREHMQLLLQMKVRVAARALVHALCVFHAWLCSCA
jgi:hypothetical protein